MKIIGIILVIVLFTYSFVSSKIVRARVDSCPGCQLNRLPEVRSFIFDDIPKYENVEFNRIHGAPPELVLLNELDEELERIPLKDLNRNECNELLQNKGFHEMKNNKEL